MDKIPFVLQQVACCRRYNKGRGELAGEKKGLFVWRMFFCFGCFGIGVGWLFSIQNTVICFCSIKPLLTLYKCVNVGWRQLLKYLTKE